MDESMIIAIDIGNTIIDVGIFQGNQIIKRVKLSTRKEATKSEYASLLYPYISQFKGKIKGAIISCVVPTLTSRFVELAKEWSQKVLVVNGSISTGLKILYKIEELGADRIADAVAVIHYYSLPAIVVDFGTALTIEVITEKREYLGGVIIPGMSISLSSLYEKTSLLSPVRLSIPDSMIGKNTSESIRAGIIYGYASLVEGMVKKLSSIFSKNPQVIFTGGDSELISQVVEIEHIVDPLLTLKGLKILFEINKGG
ncbi:type III pantothenate kinase [Candidatus Calescamantes bacterium]|nr:type III pantothenate kinase [Candidatus Calescamantes bacterium]